MNLDNAMCITLYQPWASAVALGLKKFETRNWSPKHRGPLLIHAAKKWTPKLRATQADLATKARMLLGCAYPGLFELETAKLPLGCIVAVVNLVVCRHTTSVYDRPEWVENLSELQRLFGDFSEGRWGWHLASVVRLLEPVPCAGRQQLWRPSAEVLAAVRGQMTEVS